MAAAIGVDLPVNEPSGKLSICWIRIHQLLQIGEQFGHSLHFIEDQKRAEVIEKSPGIGGCLQPMIQIFQGNIGVGGEKGFGKSGLSALPGTHKGDHRVLFCVLEDVGGRCLGIIFTIIRFNLKSVGNSLSVFLLSV